MSDQSKPEPAVDIPSAVSIQADVKPQTVPVYDSAGHELFVAADQIEYWLGRGFTRKRIDPASCGRELFAQAEAASAALKTLGAAASAGRVTDADRVTAHVAIAELVAAYAALEQALGGEPASGQPVAMVDEAGQEKLVDPGQVALYQEKGWKAK